MRHGRAGHAPTDAERQLTEQGREDVRRVSRALRERGVVQVTIFSSPLIRARETAEILAQVLDVNTITILPQLTSGASLEQLLVVIQELASRHAVALVGHMPEMGVLSAYLATGERGKAMDLAASAVVCVDIVQSRPNVVATMRWQITPGELS